MYAEAQDPTPKKTKWENQYPADPSQAVTIRLNEYLKMLGTVDFNAQLALPDKYKKKLFVNKDYEKKSAEWKAVYRAGKEVNEAISAGVKEWLKTGVKSGKTSS